MKPAPPPQLFKTYIADQETLDAIKLLKANGTNISFVIRKHLKELAALLNKNNSL